MDRQTKVTLHRERDGSDQVRMIDEGTAQDMIAHIMNQPRVKRSEYSIMEGTTVYQPSEIDDFARQFGLLEETPVTVDKDGKLFS
jgi:hypothetical protein